MPAQALDRTRATPLWEQLLTDLRRRLDHDEFAVAFPGELALVAEYGVSRHTVREAVRRLREEGLVIAGRGRTPRRAEPLPIEQPLGRSTACSRPSRRLDRYSAASCAPSTSAPTGWWPRGWGWRSRRRWCTSSGFGWPMPSRWPSTACGCPSGSRRRCSTSTSAAPRSTREYAEKVRGAGHGRQRGDLRRRRGRRAAEPPRHRAGGGGARDRPARVRGEEPSSRRHTLVRADRFSVTARFSAADGYRVGGA